jgi:hypothetical protein
MSELYFRTGETEGFTSKKLADKKSGYANPIRELLQNSLDASKEAGNNRCEINIYIESIDKATIPRIKDYEHTLNTAIKFQKSVGSYNRNSKQIVNTIHQELRKDEIKVLMFVDNGKGMSSDILNGLIGERSVKSSEGSGGSFGVGHLSPYFLSSLRYVLYASKYNNDNKGIETLYSGVPILAGFEDDEATRGATGRILKDIPENEKKPKFIFPTTYPDFIQDKMDKLETTGSMVAILGLNKEWDRDANYAIVSNFFYAINKQELIIKIDHGNISVSIDKSDIDRLLEKNQDNKRAMGGNILCGSDVYQAWLAVKDDNHKSKIDLDNGDKICIHIRNNIETDSVVVLIRNGMLIARHDKMLANEINSLRKNEDFEPFSVVINVDEKECPKLFKLVKGAENPYHNQLEKNRLIEQEEKQLKKLFKELSERIKSFLKARDRSGSLVSIPLLEIPNKAEAQGLNTTKPRSQTPKAKPNVNTPKPPINRVKTTNNGKKRPAPVIISRYLEAKNSMRMKDKGDTIDIKLNITPQNIEAKDEVYLSMSLAQDKDNDESGKALDFVSLSIDDMDVEILDFIEVTKDGETEKIKTDKSQIKLGKLLEAQTYSVVATIKKPKNIKGISVALKPFLGLKQRGK